jgi:hypothetical protein
LKANPQFLNNPKEFWAYVRTISQEIGYTNRGNKRKQIAPTIKIPILDDVLKRFRELNLSTAEIADQNRTLTDFGQKLFAYFAFRAAVLNESVQGYFMDKDIAEQEFKKLKAQLKPKCPLPLNKQTGKKKNFAFLTGIVNMLVEANIGTAPCNYDPRSLTTMTHNSMPLRTLSRRVDGAFPAVINPIAIWEIKEYYYTTTFGSRVADGVYETLLDGMELEELEAASQRKVQHVLFIDDRFTWWDCGRSYLCRMIDMLHMGYVDEIVFGREVLTRLPELAREWKSLHSTFEG